MRRLLVLRPEPGNGETVARAAAAGWRAIALPLFETRAVAWDAPDPDGFDALMLTSANAVRFGGPALARCRSLPVLAVGEATARAARDAGFGDVRAGTGDAAALLTLARDVGLVRLLHLAGREYRETDASGAEIVRVVVYAAEEAALDATDLVAARADVALIHSPRAGLRLAALAPPELRARIRLAAISSAAAAAAGPGWIDVVVAGRPTDPALLAAAATLCDQAGGE